MAGVKLSGAFRVRGGRLQPARMRVFGSTASPGYVRFGSHKRVSGVLGGLRFAISRATLWLGGISYSLYLSHRNLGHSTMSSLHELGVPVWILFTITLAGALILAAALTYLVERPALKALRHWYRTRAAPGSRGGPDADRQTSISSA